MRFSRYTASYAPTKDGTGHVMSFRHPLRKDPRGKRGRKVRRGLGTADKARAQSLIDQMNALLGEPSWHSITKRSEAERRFDPIVVRAFYDDIETTPHSSWDLRNSALPLPGTDDGYTQVMMVGTTGAGKTSLLRHLIGSHPEHDRFPSTSASRTTISDIEVITSDEPTYRAVVTFFNEWAVHTYVHECVASACAALWEDLPDDRLADRFLTHRDLRFRLGYVIGSWRQTHASDESDRDWDYDEDQSRDDIEKNVADGPLPAADLERMHEILCSFLERVRGLAATAKQRLETELNVDLTGLSGGPIRRRRRTCSRISSSRWPILMISSMTSWTNSGSASMNLHPASYAHIPVDGRNLGTTRPKTAPRSSAPSDGFRPISHPPSVRS